jgi:predicted nucleic-acid-binding Zn-ribbon protein
MNYATFCYKSTEWSFEQRHLETSGWQLKKGLEIGFNVFVRGLPSAFGSIAS